MVAIFQDYLFKCQSQFLKNAFTERSRMSLTKYQGAISNLADTENQLSYSLPKEVGKARYFLFHHPQQQGYGMG